MQRSPRWRRRQPLGCRRKTHCPSLPKPILPTAPVLGPLERHTDVVEPAVLVRGPLVLLTDRLEAAGLE